MMEELLNMFKHLVENSDSFLIIPFALIMGASLILTILSNFIQIRGLRIVYKVFKRSLRKEKLDAAEANNVETDDVDYDDDDSTIPPLNALAVAMSTTIGISNIVGPIMAIGFGGPGALAGFVIGTFLGCSTTYTEVLLALKYRKRFDDGTVAGGPMQYLHDEFGPILSNLYAYFGFALLVAWSSNQSNTVAVLLNETAGIPQWTSGAVMAGLVMYVMINGVSLIGQINRILVPAMFALYTGATLWIILYNYQMLPGIVRLICNALWDPVTALGASAGIGMQHVFRWGFARAIQSNELGTGTATFPHSVAEANPTAQASLAMMAVYSNGFLCLLSGLTVLVTGAWQESGATFDVTMFAKILKTYYSFFGPLLLSTCASLFAFGTILGNCFNGSQCFLYFTKNRWLNIYYGFSAASILLGSVLDVKFVWSVVDFFILPVAIPHIIAIVIIAFRNRSIFSLNKALRSPSTVQIQPTRE